MTRRLAAALAKDTQRAIVRLFLGVKCDHCNDYYRGPRTLDNHLWADHGDL